MKLTWKRILGRVRAGAGIGLLFGLAAIPIIALIPNRKANSPDEALMFALYAVVYALPAGTILGALAGLLSGLFQTKPKK